MNNNILNIIKHYWQHKPLVLILFLALIFRMLAAVFSQGFGMHDDHFIVIEAAQSWVDGTDYNSWLPSSQENAVPKGHSFFYVGLHYFLFSFLEFIGILNPQIKMLIVRFLHALLSLIVVYAGFKITERLQNRNTAKQVGLFLAILWFMPFLSVRNLIEVVCIPFLIFGLWRIIKYDKGDSSISTLKQYFIAGLIMGTAFSVRFQTSLFIGGVGLAILLLKKWKEAISFGSGALVSIMIIQGITDYMIWGYPFAELMEYVTYNIGHRHGYIAGPWYNYILLITGLLIPPIGVFLFFGFLRTWRKHLLLFLPVFIFLAFHSYFPSKQERFILPIIPFIIILGFVGWNDFFEQSKFWQARKKIYSYCMIFFWIINLSLLPIISTAYSKKARVESMIYLSQFSNIRSILIEDSNRSYAKIPPQFYLGQWIAVHEISQRKPIDSLKEKLKSIVKSEHPNFVLFNEENQLAQRIKAVEAIMPIQYKVTIEPGLIDKIMHWLNPVNANQTIYIYSVKSPE